MIHPRWSAVAAARLTSLALVIAATLLLGAGGCRSDRTTDPRAAGSVTVVGTLVDIMDGRSHDAGIDLTLETTSGVRVLARVPSIFRPPPREWVQAMHNVVDRSKLGDRLRARGKRDESGAIQVEELEKVSR